MSTHNLKLCCPPDAVFIASRLSGRAFVDVEQSGRRQLLPLCRDLADLSPSGFEWAPRHFGSRQLAVAMLSFVAGTELALSHYDDFATEFIPELALDGWRLPATAVLNWLRIVVGDDTGLDSKEGRTNG